MIPREILKNIRQSELRTNRIVTESMTSAAETPSTLSMTKRTFNQ